MSAARPLRIGTRGSPLALAQARAVRDVLVGLEPDAATPPEIVVISTTGDQVLDRPLAEIGGKGLFTKELDAALLNGNIDLAVHSMKDVETVLPDGIVIACLLPREDPRDVLISRVGATLAALPEGAVIGTASLRRGAQILSLRPDLRVVLLRGNVQTRLDKLEAGAVDATLLALAGLRRLGMADVATAILEPEEMLPAVAQGAIGVTVRAGDAATAARLAALDDPPTVATVTTERAMLAALDGSCRTPVGGYATLSADGAEIRLRSLLAAPDGTVVHRDDRSGPAAAGPALGQAAGEALLEAAGDDLRRRLGLDGAP